MANRTIFRTMRGTSVPSADAVNEQGGVAYRRSAKQALAQYVATGCFNGTFYATAEEQFDKVIAFCEDVEVGFIARLAIYGSSRFSMGIGLVSSRV